MFQNLSDEIQDAVTSGNNDTATLEDELSKFLALPIDRKEVFGDETP